MSTQPTAPEQVPLQQSQTALERWSAGAKDFYSAGASFSTIACAGTVLIIWSTLAELLSMCRSPLCELLLSFLIVFAYAFVLPEPPGYADEGKLKLTPAESIFGFLNSLLVFSVASGLRDMGHKL